MMIFSENLKVRKFWYLFVAAILFAVVSTGCQSRMTVLPGNSAANQPTPTPTGSYKVLLTWDAPVASTDPVAGYNVYRSPSGASAYAVINTSVDAVTTYTDPTVSNGTAYDYIVESVDAQGNQSAPSNVATVDVPATAPDLRIPGSDLLRASVK